jgi:hypothetical protein
MIKMATMAIAEIIIKKRTLYSDSWLANNPNATPGFRMWVMLKKLSITRTEKYRGM